MLMKVSILVVALIGIAAAGQNFQNLFSSSNFRKLGQYPIIYLVPVAPATAASTTAAPTTAAPTTAATVTKAPPVIPNQQLTDKVVTEAQRNAVAAGYSLRTNRVRTICPTTSAGVKTYRGALPSLTGDQCVFCFCSEMISSTSSADSLANCRTTACAGATPSAATTWTTISSAKPWVSLGVAVDYELYSVPSGYCFIEPNDIVSRSRVMRCYESNP